MVKSLFLTLYIFSFCLPSFGFVARIIDSNKNSCEQETDINLAVDCFQQSSLTENNLGLSSSLSQLNNDISQIGDLILPLEFARKRSLEIVKKAQEQADKNEKFKKELEAGATTGDSPEFKDHSEHFQVVLGLEYRLAELEGTLKKCFSGGRGGNKAAFEKCQEEREEKLAPIKNQINQEYARFPLLQERSIQERLKEKVDERLNNSETGNLAIFNDLKKRHSQCKSNTRRKRTRGRKKKKKKSTTPSCDEQFLPKIADAEKKLKEDIVFPIDENENRELFLKGLEAAKETTDDVLARHQKTADQIEEGLAEFGTKPKRGKRRRKQNGLSSLEDLHSDIFKGTSSETLNRLTEYQLSLDPRLIEQDPTYRFAACKITKEKDANELNDQIQSYALDAATLLIPFGGAYFVSAKSLAKIAKSVNSVDKARKIAKGRQLVVAGLEAGVGAVDVANLNAKAEFCKTIENKNLALNGSNQKLQEMKEECKAVLDDHTLSTSLAVLGGAAGTVFGVLGASTKNLSKIDGLETPEVLERKRLADEAIKKQTGKESDITLAQAVEVEQAHRIGRGEIGEDGINPAGVDNLTDSQKRRKAKQLKAAGFDQDQRRALFEEEVVGDQVPGLGARIKSAFKKDPSEQLGFTVPRSHNSPFDFLPEESKAITEALTKRFIGRNSIEKLGVKINTSGGIEFAKNGLKNLTEIERLQIKNFVSKFNEIINAPGFKNISDPNERIDFIADVLSSRRPAGPSDVVSSVKTEPPPKLKTSAEVDTPSKIETSSGVEDPLKLKVSTSGAEVVQEVVTASRGGFSQKVNDLTLRFRKPKTPEEFKKKIELLEAKARTKSGKKHGDLRRKAKALEQEFKEKFDLPDSSFASASEDLFLKLKNLGDSATVFHPNAKEFVRQLDSITPAQRKAVFNDFDVRTSLLSKVDDNNVIDLLNSSQLERSARFSHNFTDLRIDVTDAHAEIFNNKLVSKFFPEDQFPPGTVKLVNGKIEVDASKIKGDPVTAKAHLDKFSEEIKDFYYDGSGDELEFYDQLFASYKINDPDLLLDTKRAVIGDITLKSRHGWEEAGTVEALRAFGVKFDYDDATDVLQISKEDISEVNLAIINRAKKRAEAAFQAGDRKYGRPVHDAQEAFLKEINTPEQVRKRLNSTQRDLIPEQLDLTKFQDANGNPIQGFQKVEFTESNFLGRMNQETPEFNRTAFRNNETGVSFLETRDAKTNELMSVEVIAARDVNDPSKGVEFLSYENGTLSSQFKLGPKSKSHSSVGFGCMSCHGARVQGPSLQAVSSFSPLGAGGASDLVKNDPNGFLHPSVKKGNLTSIVLSNKEVEKRKKALKAAR